MAMPPGWEVPQGIRDRLSDRAGRQRAMVVDDHLLLILHEVPEPGAAKREGIYFWRSPQGVWKSSVGGAGSGGAGREALQQLLNRYGAAVQVLEEQYDSASSATDYFHILERAVPLHRAARNLQAALQIARESLPEVRELIGLRDWAGDIERASELLSTDAHNALNYSIARQGEEQARLSHQLNEVGYRFNLMGAIFLPLMAVASVFGMNLPTGLEGSSPALFWAITACTVGFGLILLAVMSRRGSRK